jgi:hypothetical protein
MDMLNAIFTMLFAIGFTVVSAYSVFVIVKTGSVGKWGEYYDKRERPIFCWFCIGCSVMSFLCSLWILKIVVTAYFFR